MAPFSSNQKFDAQEVYHKSNVFNYEDEDSNILMNKNTSKKSRSLLNELIKEDKLINIRGNELSEKTLKILDDIKTQKSIKIGNKIFNIFP